MPSEPVAVPAAPAVPAPVTPPAAAPNSDTGNAPGSETQVVQPNSGEKLFSQADFERELGVRLTRERAKNEAAATKAAADAATARQVEQGEFKQLAEDRKATIDTLTPKAELADKLSEIFTKQLDAELATWPEEARPLVLPAESPLLQRIESADRARPIAQKLLAATGALGAPAPPPPGTRFPEQHPGGGAAAPITSKAVAENTLKKAYAPRKEK